MPKPFIMIELDRPRRLRFGFNQLCELEDLLKIPITKLREVDLGMKEIRLFLYVGLKWEDPSLTPEKIGDLIDDYVEDWTDLAAKITEAISASFGKNQPGPAGNSTVN